MRWQRHRDLIQHMTSEEWIELQQRRLAREDRVVTGFYLVLVIGVIALVAVQITRPWWA